MPLRSLCASTALLMVATIGMATPAMADPSDDYINADRPGIADGSTTVGKNRFQLETAIQAEFRHDGDEHERTIFFPTLLRLGLSMLANSAVARNRGHGRLSGTSIPLESFLLSHHPESCVWRALR